jgi:hypothetical protein
MIFSVKSIQKDVPHTPDHETLPIEPGIRVGSVLIAKPSPHVAPNAGPIISLAKRMSAGSAFEVILLTVCGERIRTPLSSPFLSSIRQTEDSLGRSKPVHPRRRTAPAPWLRPIGQVVHQEAEQLSVVRVFETTG